MQPLIIDNPRIIELVRRAAEKRNGSVEEALIAVLSHDAALPGLDLPDAETLAATHGIAIEDASKLIEDATWREWTQADVDAEIIWLQQVRDNPGVAKRTLPGLVAHTMRITQLPDRERRRLASLPDYNEEIYDEFGLPR